MMKFAYRSLLPVSLLAACVVVGCSGEPEPAPAAQPEPVADVQSPPETVIDDSTLGNEADGRNWLAYGRTYSEQRFSPLDEINRDTVAELSVDWYLDLPGARGLVSTPLVADGVLYFIESMNRVHAVDVRTPAADARI